MRTDTWQQQETAWAVCLVLKDVDQRLSLLDLLWILLSSRIKLKEGRLKILLRNPTEVSHWNAPGGFN